jgi:hypothetical protein
MGDAASSSSLTSKEFRLILMDVTAVILEQLRADSVANIQRGMPADWPTTYDINCGWCEEWAAAVETRVTDATGVWLEEPSGLDYAHYAILFRGRWYDTECIDGVVDFHDLPLVRNGGMSRNEVLTNRAKERLWDRLTNLWRHRTGKGF